MNCNPTWWQKSWRKNDKYQVCATRMWCIANIATIHCFVDEGFPLSPKCAYGSEGQSLSSTVCCLIQSQLFLPLHFLAWNAFLNSLKIPIKSIYKIFHQVQPSYASWLQGKTCRIGKGAEGEVRSKSRKMEIFLEFASDANTPGLGWSPRDYWWRSITEK